MLCMLRILLSENRGRPREGNEFFGSGTGEGIAALSHRGRFSSYI
jgi:hypothetical protein